MKNIIEYITEKFRLRDDTKINHKTDEFQYKKIIDVLNDTDWKCSRNISWTNPSITLRVMDKKPSKDIVNELKVIQKSIDKTNHRKGWYNVHMYTTQLITQQSNSDDYIKIEITCRDIYSPAAFDYDSTITLIIINSYDAEREIKKYRHRFPDIVIKNIAATIADKYDFEYLKR